jgi:2-amino-4-hydroxy-6-hydroxymethyldihydropteridine diphosphokinase
MEEIKEKHVVIALGSNLGDKNENLRLALKEIESNIGKIERVSQFMESEPWGFESENNFLNACLTCYTRLSPHQLLAALKNIEQQLGRIKHHTSYEDRSIDLDIIFYHDKRITTHDLIVPHPQFKTRTFVMKPLLEICTQKDVFYEFISD